MWFQWFSGTLSLEKAGQARHAEIMRSLSALRDAEERHYRDGVDTLGGIVERLAKLEQHFVSQHVGRPTVNLPVYDWEQVQIQELAEMLANPPKEVA
jgi:hypothetical protein